MLKHFQSEMSTGYPGPRISQEIMGSKKPGTKKSRDIKSRDEACEKIPEFSSLSWVIPTRFFCPFFSNFHFSFPKDFLMSNNTYPQSTFLCQVLRK